MKQYDLNNISNFLRKIRINKIKNKETKIELINIHMALYKKVLDWKKDLEELQKKFFEGKEAELDLYNKQVLEIQNAASEKQAELEAALDPEMKNLVTEFNELVNQMLEKDVPVKLTKIDKDRFIEALIDLDIDFTCDDLIILKDLYK
jgi:hypothetical protein